MHNFKSLIAAVAMAATLGPMGTQALATDMPRSWVLDPALSNVSFGSIKNDYAGESHSFGKTSGTVSEDGTVTIKLGLGSVETNIDIRNERMIEFVFNNAPDATITAQIDMAELKALPIGGSTNINTYGTLSLLGIENELEANFFVMRISETQVLVDTNGMVMLSTEDAEIDAGIDTLQQLADLDGITRVSPVSLRLIFNAKG
ncbi:YceI family protein [Roseobacter denitrificans]|uniref:Lipid/polyisoprenoid-binding YceI-like domain-containing protein n=1 Tax=Roseobacter denitrificans (strain ATCC 33942 / OCh 114) TaxID=375451 RepID=Q160W2_ROSDO|nr:YceI family protein [Roseobacter denitrificans]ABG33481.1 hypothetical protein RD1_4036 [Roseobacter denitrificans OCh 114]AVL52797.1 YceI family protein [Roseobacter denitrificans]SFG05392.1 Polyisoprenoid-binding protein YceI [Roseobacter denitrificans OCh 114]